MQNDDSRLSAPAIRSPDQPSAELRRIGRAVIVLATLAFSSLETTRASAQHETCTHQAGYRVAVVDVCHIFKNLPAVKEQASKTRSERKQYEAKRKQERDALKQAVERLKTLEAGTPEYSRQEDHVAKLDSKFRLRTGHRHHGVSDAEAKIYLDNYQRITDAVTEIATRHNIGLVLRIDSTEMDLDHTDSITRRVTGHVVYHDSTINITDAVIRLLDQQPKTSPAGPEDGAAPRGFKVLKRGKTTSTRSTHCL